jgi:hypothetical protein
VTTTPTALVTGAYVGNTTTSMYVSPVGTTTVVTKCTLTNVTGTSCEVTVHLSSSLTTNPESPLQTVTVPANSCVVVSALAQLAVPAGGSILMVASTAATCVCKMAGVQFA